MEEVIMTMVNVTIVGYLTKTPQLQMFQSGKVKTNISLGVSYPSRTDSAVEHVDYYKVEAWGRTAENVVKYLQKGNQIVATGRMAFEHWTDQSGRERSTPVITATQITFLPRGNKSHANDYSKTEGSQSAATSNTGPALVAVSSSNNMPAAEKAEQMATTPDEVTEFAGFDEGVLDEAEADSLLAGSRSVSVVAEPKNHYRPKSRYLSSRR
jgi:single-strand DNA-binding protein